MCPILPGIIIPLTKACVSAPDASSSMRQVTRRRAQSAVWDAPHTTASSRLLCACPLALQPNPRYPQLGMASCVLPHVYFFYIKTCYTVKPVLTTTWQMEPPNFSYTGLAFKLKSLCDRTIKSQSLSALICQVLLYLSQNLCKVLLYLLLNATINVCNLNKKQIHFISQNSCYF